MQSNLIDQLLYDFGNYRNTTSYTQQLRAKGVPISGTVNPNTKSGKILVAAFEQMIVFCAQNEIDPRLWLYTMFKSRKFLFAPKPAQFCSAKHIPKHHRILSESREKVAYVRQGQLRVQEARAASGADYDKNRDITYSAEALKERYIAAGEYQRCIDLMQTHTLGFHPKSQTCMSCPAAQACTMKLRGLTPHMDIVTLRASANVPMKGIPLHVA